MIHRNPGGGHFVVYMPKSLCLVWMRTVVQDWCTKAGQCDEAGQCEPGWLHVYASVMPIQEDTLGVCADQFLQRVGAERVLCEEVLERNLLWE